LGKNIKNGGAAMAGETTQDKSGFADYILKTGNIIYNEW